MQEKNQEVYHWHVGQPRGACKNKTILAFYTKNARKLKIRFVIQYNNIVLAIAFCLIFVACNTKSQAKSYIDITNSTHK